jgi:predicted DNA-binding transcriptional regulator YafY
VRADRLVSLVLLLQARGRTSARVLADDLEVSVRTIYRDLAALGAAGVPVIAESGPGGGCELLDGYRFGLRGLRPEEAEALLILGIPDVLTDLGLDTALAAAQHQVRVTAGLSKLALVHLDMPRWFASPEPVPELRIVARAVRLNRMLAFRYRDSARTVGPLGLVNKAGVWYLVADDGDRRISVYRVARIGSGRLLDARVERPDGFELSAFWASWSVEFAASRPRMPVTVKASPAAFRIFPEVFGDSVREAMDGAGTADADGWRVVTLTFEHERAAAHRLAGFGNLIEVLSPAQVRDRLLATAYEIIGRYGSLTESGRTAPPR